MAAALSAANPSIESPQWRNISFSEPPAVAAVTSDDSILVIQDQIGLQRSRNGGSSWEQLVSFQGGWITALASLKMGFFAATSRAIYHSNDAGSTWTSRWEKSSLRISSGNVVGFRSNGDTLWAVFAPDPERNLSAMRMVSLDGGITWGEPLEWAGSLENDPVEAGDALFALLKGGLQCSRDGGKSWNPIPLNPNWGLLTYLSAKAGELYATTRSGALLRSSDQGINFLRVPFEGQLVRIQSFSADGSDLCVSTITGISCSRDGGASWSYLWDLPIAGTPHLTLSRGFLYVTASRDYAESGIWRGEIATGSWVFQDSPKDFGPYAPILSARNDTLLALSRHSASPMLRSLDRGKTWDSLPGRPVSIVPDNVFQSKGIWGISGLGEDYNLAIFLSRDSGAQWIRFPVNPKALIRDHDVIVWKSHLYVLGDQGGLWEGNLQSGEWSPIEMPNNIRTQSLVATDSALYFPGLVEIWRLDGVGETTSTQALRRSPQRDLWTKVTHTGTGRIGVRVFPGPETGVRPGAYNLKGSMIRE